MRIFSSDKTNRTPASAIPLQKKLAIGKSNDRFEQEADRVADKVVNNNTASQPVVQGNSADKNIERSTPAPILQKMEEEEPELQTKPKPSIMKMEEVLQRKGEEEEIQAKMASGTQLRMSTEVDSGIQRSRGKGSSMPENIRNHMESGIGADFSEVKIHNDSQSHQLSNQLNARAFTVGSDVYFNKGEYNPSSRSGQHLLAHELTHTVQQGKSPAVSNTIQRQDKKPQVSEEERKQSFVSPLKLWKHSTQLVPIGSLKFDQNIWILQDFPINDYQFPAAKGSVEAALQPILDRIKQYNSGNGIGIQFLISGVASSTGDEIVNEELRALRALHMEDRAPKPLKDRITSAEPTYNGFYIASNESLAGRAKNRSVIIEERIIETEPAPDDSGREGQWAKRVMIPNYPGWIEVDGNNFFKPVRELPHFMRVRFVHNGTLIVDEGIYIGQVAAYKQPQPDPKSNRPGQRKINTDWYFKIIKPKPAASLEVEYLADLGNRAGHMVTKGVLRGAGGEITFVTDTTNPVPEGTHDIEIPDYQHHKTLDRSAHGSTWFRLGHSGDRYLHPGSFSAGCITVIGNPDSWESIYHTLIEARKDYRSVGVMNVKDSRPNSGSGAGGSQGSSGGGGQGGNQDE